MKEPKSVGFIVEEIGLQEAETLVAAGEGKYSDVILMLSQKLPELEAANMGQPVENRKSFGFRLPGNGTLDEKMIKGLCHSVNLAIHKQGIEWNLRYSSRRKLFVCVPLKTKEKKILGISQPKLQTEKKTEDKEALIAKIKELHAEGKSYRNVANLLGISIPRLNYLIWPKKEKTPNPNPRYSHTAAELWPKILALKNQGMMAREIAKTLSISMSTVYDTTYKMKNRGGAK